MRAMMSDTTRRGPLGCRHLGMLAPREAEVEARAILAETEDGRRYATLAYLRLSRMPANVVACDALAESLRSFLEA